MHEQCILHHKHSSTPYLSYVHINFVVKVTYVHNSHTLHTNLNHLYSNKRKVLCFHSTITTLDSMFGIWFFMQELRQKEDKF